MVNVLYVVGAMQEYASYDYTDTAAEYTVAAFYQADGMLRAAWPDHTISASVLNTLPACLVQANKP